jgi:hypothetical protein
MERFVKGRSTGMARTNRWNIYFQRERGLVLPLLQRDSSGCGRQKKPNAVLLQATEHRIEVLCVSICLPIRLLFPNGFRIRQTTCYLLSALLYVHDFLFRAGESGLVRMPLA